MNIPKNTGVTTLNGLLVNAAETKGGSQMVQILIEESNMGIDNMVQLLNCWSPANFDECKKLVDKPVTFPAVRGFGDDPYRVPKNSHISPLKA